MCHREQHVKVDKRDPKDAIIMETQGGDLEANNRPGAHETIGAHDALNLPGQGERDEGEERVRAHLDRVVHVKWVGRQKEASEERHLGICALFYPDHQERDSRYPRDQGERTKRHVTLSNS